MKSKWLIRGISLAAVVGVLTTSLFFYSHTSVSATSGTVSVELRANNFTPGELIDKRTRTSKTYELAPNKYALDATIGSVHYLKDSQWVEIDPVLLPTAEPYYRQMTDANYQVYVMEEFNAGQIAKFSKGGQSVEFQPMALEWINELEMIQPIAMPHAVTPIVDHEIIDNYLPSYSPHVGKIEWLDAYGQNIHFEWQTTNTRLNKIITVSGLNDLPPPEPYLGDNVSLRFNMIFAPTAGLDIFVDGVLWDKKTKVQTFDHIYFIDQNDTVLWSFAPLLYWDSSNNPETGQGQSIATLEKRGNKLYISVLVPYEWLESATFPVFIDVDVDEVVAASEDDGVEDYTTGNTVINLGFWSIGSSAYEYSGVRYASVTIPNGATINAANLTCYSQIADSGSYVAYLYGEDTSAPSVYTAGEANYDITSRSRTTANVTISSTVLGDWAIDTVYYLPDMSAIVQELVDSYDYSGGAAMAFMSIWISGTGERMANTWDADPNTAVKLHIEYTPGAGTVIPTVVTGGAMTVEETTATMQGNITNTGGENCTARGFEWDTASGVPYSDNNNALGDFGTGNFTYGASGLTKGEGYFYRASANNSAGWGYGAEVFFITKPDPATSFVSTNNGTTWLFLGWTNGDGADYVEVRYDSGAVAPADNISGTLGYWGSGTSINVTGLTCNTQYSFRIFTHATENGQWSTSDNNPAISDTTDACAGVAPTVTSDNSTLVEETTATCSGNITAIGSDNSTSRFIQYGTATLTYTDNETEFGDFGVGIFSLNLTGLSPGTTYYWRAGANNTAGNGFGGELNFTTKPEAVTGFTATGSGSSNITLSWTLGVGSENTTIRYRTDAYPTDPANGTSGYNGTASACNLTSLIPGQIYYVCAWAINTDNSTIYSDDPAQLIRYTRPGTPTGATTDNVTCNSIDVSWTLGTGGDYTMVRWSAGDYPLDEADGHEGYYGTANLSTIYGLTHSTEIFFSLFSRDSDSGYYSITYAQTTNTTGLTGAPTVTTANATDITNTTATLSGNITDISCDQADVRGFQWGVSTGNYTANWTAGGAFPVGVYTYGASGLSENTTYYYRSVAHNDGGWAFGNEINFTSTNVTDILPPISFIVADMGAVSLNITWTKANASSNLTLIRASRTDYPSSITDGELVYYGSNVSYNASGYSITNVVYYFSAWGVDNSGTVYSTEYVTATIGEEGVTVMATTLDMTPFILLLPLMFLAVLAYWKPNPILFLIIAGVAIFSGFEWFNTLSGDYREYAMAVSVGFIAFAILNFGFAIKLLVWKEAEGEE